jgi:regulator of replication initiation timing
MMFDDIDLNAIQDKNAREVIMRLLNMIEKLSAELREVKEENQRLRDEINRLKGEQGKPKIEGNKPQSAAINHSSEKERREPRKRHKGSKKAKIEIEHEEVAKVKREDLPEDAEFKGYEEMVVQDIILKTNNVRFLREKYYSKSMRKSYLGELPQGYEGQFGPGVKTLVPELYFDMGMSEPKILGLLRNIGIQISKGTVSNLLIKAQDKFHAEKDGVYEAGLRSTSWQHTDDTQTRVNGQNEHCHVVCNPVYTVYITLPRKDRLSVLDVLRNGRERRFRLNQEALDCLEKVQLSQPTRQLLQTWVSETEMDEVAFEKHLERLLPNLGEQQRKAITDAAAIAAYHQETEWPVIQALICDDAPQFNWLTYVMMLCWVHEGRPYKKLMPVVALHRQILDAFLKFFWNYYHQLLAYKQQPTPEESARMEADFDTLFATHTGYDQLDKRIAKTRAKKASLLLVLQHPELPLHNNPAELGARQRVRKRDISFGPRTQEGRKAWDTFMSLAETAKKLDVSFFAYLHDRITGTHAIPPLAELVTIAAKNLNLTSSWVAT